MKKNIFRFVFVVACSVVFLAACSSTPSSSTIESQVTKFIKNDQLYSVLSVEKTNGRKVNDNEYIADVTYKVKFKMGFPAMVMEMQRQANGDFSAQLQAVDAANELAAMFGRFKAGDVKTAHGHFEFVKTDNGWELKHA